MVFGIAALIPPQVKWLVGRIRRLGILFAYITMRSKRALPQATNLIGSRKFFENGPSRIMEGRNAVLSTGEIEHRLNSDMDRASPSGCWDRSVGAFRN